jgi:ribosome-binding protein aMBF1 (putative translation factor)
MNWCEGCQQLEGEVKSIEIDGEEIRVCAYCDEEIQRVPEHDDLEDR